MAEDETPAAEEGVEEIEVPEVPEPDEPDPGVIYPTGTYTEGHG